MCCYPDIRTVGCTLKAHLKSDEKYFVPETLYNFYIPVNYVSCKFSQLILININAFNKLLQQKAPDHFTVYSTLINLVKSWINTVVLPNKKISDKYLFKVKNSLNLKVSM